MATWHSRLTEPLESVTALFGSILALSVVAGVVLALTGTGSLGGFGHDASVCATRPGFGTSSSNNDLLGTGLRARSGASLSVLGSVSACASHPSFGQRVLMTLTEVPGMMVWALVLLLAGRLLLTARRTGPFAPQAAVIMHRLGWVILGGSVLAGAVQGAALDGLLNTMMTPGNDYAGVATGALQGLVPVPLLAGAALLTLARFFQVGASMDDELKSTV